jgi:integrase
VKNGYIKTVPYFPKIKVENERLAFFSKEEEEQILSFLKKTGENYFYDFFCWQVDTGCRPSEARCIKAEHIREDKELGHVVDLFKTKNKKQRTIPLTRRAITSFKNQQKREFLWDYWTKERIRTVWDKVKNHLGKKGDKNFVFYLTRHTCGSRIVQATGSIYLVKSMLGHSTIGQSTRYGQLAPHNLRQALCALDGELEVAHLPSFDNSAVIKKEETRIA